VGFACVSPVIPDYIDDFIEAMLPANHYKNDYKVVIKTINSGIVIDHTGEGDNEETICKSYKKPYAF